MNKIIMIRNAAMTDFGGAERYPIFLSQEMEKHNYKTILLSRSEKLLKFARNSDISTERGWWWSNQNWSGARALLFPVYIVWQMLLVAFYLVEFIRLKPQVVHIQSKDDFIGGTIAAKLLRKKVIWTDHADLKHIWKNVRVWYKNPVGKAVYLASYLADVIVAVGENEKTLIVANLSSNSPITAKVRRIYNGTNDKITKYKKKINENFIFVIASRLVTDKGIGEAIRAFQKLSKGTDKIELRILGDGPEVDQFKALADGNKNIKFLGHLIDPLHEMVNADVFLQPTHHEAFSIAVVEACMLKLPVIATAIGGNPEIIKNGVTGLLVEPRSSESLYEAMKQLYTSKKTRDTLATNARKQYEKKFNFSNIVRDEYLPIYKR